MGVTEYDTRLDPIKEHRIFVDAKHNPMVLIFKSQCHHYYANSILECFTDGNQLRLPPSFYKNGGLLIPKSKEKHRVAIIVSGTLRRYDFKSSLIHLINPLSKQGHSVDYYLALGTADQKAYRDNAEYMNRLEYDPIIKDYAQNHDNYYALESFINSSIASYGGKLAKILLNQTIDIDSNELVQSRRNWASKRFPNEDPDLRFPIKDLRSTNKIRTANANRNLLRLHLGVQYLWESLVQIEEQEVNKYEKYDYVLFFRDDAHWLNDFDLNKLIKTAPSADVYVLSCDAR